MKKPAILSFVAQSDNQVAAFKLIQYATMQEAIREITEYIEVFYNRQRIQAKRGYLSPVAYKQHYYQQMAAA